MLQLAISVMATFAGTLKDVVRTFEWPVVVRTLNANGKMGLARSNAVDQSSLFLGFRYFVVKCAYIMFI